MGDHVILIISLPMMRKNGPDVMQAQRLFLLVVAAFQTDPAVREWLTAFEVRCTCEASTRSRLR